MANLIESSQWVEGIYQIEEDDPVMGGADGVDNRPHKELAARTTFLRGEVEKVQQVLCEMDTVENHNNSADAHADLLKLFAKLASPALSGTPTAPTAAAADNSTKIATTAFVKAAATAANCGGIVGGSLTQNGWVKFANGLILQWGAWIVPATDNWVTCPYNIAFPKSSLRIYATSGNFQAGAAGTERVTPIAAWPCDNANFYTGCASTLNGRSFAWFAIGI